jgi:hypothetical protein
LHTIKDVTITVTTMELFHLEIDTIAKSDVNGIKKYQSMIGNLEWAVSLIGRLDVQAATMKMSRFRDALQEGFLDRLKQVYGYLKKFSSVATQVRTDTPACAELPDHDFYWLHSVYGNIEEVLPKDLP